MSKRLHSMRRVLEYHGIAVLNWARTDPDLDPIRDQPRFKAMFAAAEARLAQS
jgi:hypothetical protein